MLSRTAMLLAGKSDPQNSENWLPLWMHGKDAAEVMIRLVQRLPQLVCAAIGLDSWEQLVGTACFLGCVHDAGKATCLFQRNIMRNLPEAAERLEVCLPVLRQEFLAPEKTPHARASEAILLHMGCPAGLASVAGSHHGKTQSWDVADQIEVYSKNYWGKQSAAWETLWREFLDWALEESGFSSVEELPELSLPAQLLLTGLLIMADWIASNTRYFPAIRKEELGDPALYPDRAALAWEALALPDPWEPGRYVLDAEAFRKEFGFKPNAVQKAMLDAVERTSTPGIYILEAQMGVGKTEAALAAAEVLASRLGCGGVFFGLPTQATANGIFTRLLQWSEKQSEEMAHSVRLAHGAAALNELYRSLPTDEMMPMDEEDEGGVLVHSWFAGSKQALLADFVIGTVDQLLMAALKQKHVMLRHLGLAGKVIIVDECHAYDTYMNGYLDRALQWLGAYHVPVILLSATLPAKRRGALINAYRNQNRKRTAELWSRSWSYPLLTSWTAGGEVRQDVIPDNTPPKTVAVRTLTEPELSGVLTEKLRDGGCAGVIVNTVKKAQRIAAALRETMPDAEVFLYHAQFLQPDRAERERELLKRIGKGSAPEERNRFIVVGTQVLEQSLDIDFDLLVTELCPMDLLLQRIGRLHRHERKRPLAVKDPCCAVLDTGTNELDEASCAIYTQWLLWRTRERLPEQITLPGDIPTLVKDVYGWEEKDVLPETAESTAAREKYDKLQKDQEIHSEDYQIAEPEAEEEDPEDDELEDEIETLDGWMDRADITTDGKARAAVRDGDPSVEVLVMEEHRDGSVHFLPWQEDGAAVPTDHALSVEESLRVARQRLRLPGYFSRSWNIDRVIEELEEQNRKRLSQWQLSPMLKGELVLLLDEEQRAVLADMRLRYDRHSGLTYEKEAEYAGD